MANAVRHNHPGGTATVATGAHGKLVFIEVPNTGPTLNPQEIPDLFEPFRRGANHGNKSLGLGLAVVRAITIAHHGKVTAVPRPGGGLTVRVDLPHQTRSGPHKGTTGLGLRASGTGACL
ncbi:sensor histidine kinase [Streptomyces sp. NPDC059262]|uniref:sensor histidine kinase n=1 Tax=Streptomyces sp. NPDC059262 TaxID=3346797 RepID=UPI00369F9CE3